MADEQLDGPLSDGLGALVDEIHTLEVSEVVGHDSGDEALQLLHVEGARDIGLIRVAQRPATHTFKHSYVSRENRTRTHTLEVPHVHSQDHGPAT